MFVFLDINSSLVFTFIPDMLASIESKMAALTDHVERHNQQMATLQDAIGQLVPPVDGRPKSILLADDSSGELLNDRMKGTHKGAFLGRMKYAYRIVCYTPLVTS